MPVEVIDVRKAPDDAALNAGGIRALRQERDARKDAERRLSRLKADFQERLEALEQQVVSPARFAQGVAEIRRELAADVGRLRLELQEVADGLEQLRGMVAGT